MRRCTESRHLPPLARRPSSSVLGLPRSSNPQHYRTCLLLWCTQRHLLTLYRISRHPRQHIAPGKGAPQLPQQQQPPPPTGPHNVKGKLRAKKGPRRLNKQRQAQPAKQPPKKKTAEELDKEMEDYKARAAGNKIKTSESATFMMQLV